MFKEADNTIFITPVKNMENDLKLWRKKKIKTNRHSLIYRKQSEQPDFI